MRETIDEIILKPRRGTVLNFGPPKTGKTESLATLIKLGLTPMWYFDFDGGDSIKPLLRKTKDLCMRDRLLNEQHSTDDIIRFSYFPKGGDRVGQTQHRPKEQGRDIYLDFLKDFNSVFDLIGQDGEYKKDPIVRPPRSLVIDSTTSLMEDILDFILCMAGHNLSDPKTDARDDFGKQMGKIQEIVKSAKSMPLIAVFICHEKLVQNELTGEVRIDPMITGQLSAYFAKDFGTVVYSQSKGGKYTWLTKPQGHVKCVGQREHEGLSLEIEQDYSLVL